MGPLSLRRARARPFDSRCSWQASGMVGTSSDVVSFDLSMVSARTPGNQPATGATSVTVVGSGLGSASHTSALRFQGGPGATATEATEWVSGTAVRARMSAGVQGTLRLALTTKQGAGSRTQAFSYSFLKISRPSDRSDCVSKALQMGLLNASVAGFPIPAGFTAWLDKNADPRYAQSCIPIHQKGNPNL